MIRKFMLGAVLGAGALILSACAGMDIEKARGLNTSGTTFQKHLYHEYLMLSTSEYNEHDHLDSDKFAQRAIASAQGNMVMPEEMSAREIPDNAKIDLETSRDRLMAALSASATTKIPDQAARAQVMFDCWMQEQEENFQPKDIAACRAAFMAAMAAVDAAMKPPPPAMTPAPKTPVDSGALPGPYLVLFDHNSTHVTGEALALVRQIVKDVAATKAAKVLLEGHADRSGDGKFNMTLSKVRVDKIADALIAAGIKPSQISKSIFGENKPAVRTPDGQREKANRRVEVSLGR